MKIPGIFHNSLITVTFKLTRYIACFLQHIMHCLPFGSFMKQAFNKLAPPNLFYTMHFSPGIWLKWLAGRSDQSHQTISAGTAEEIPHRPCKSTRCPAASSASDAARHSLCACSSTSSPSGHVPTGSCSLRALRPPLTPHHQTRAALPSGEASQVSTVQTVQL